MIISNTIIYPLISMSRIEGRQNASETLEDLWTTVLPYIPEGEHSVDCCVLTSMGLYGNTSGYDRPQQRLKLARFQRDLMKQIALAKSKDPRVNPQALQSNEWDALIHQSAALGELATAYGRLKHLQSHSKGYAVALENLCTVYGREPSTENFAFFHEEFAMLYLMAKKVIAAPKHAYSLRWNENGPVYFSYPGAIPFAEALAFSYLQGRQKFPRNKAFYIDTSDRHNPGYTDLADVIGRYDSSTSHSAFVQ